MAAGPGRLPWSLGGTRIVKPVTQRSGTELPGLKRFRLFCALSMSTSLVLLLIAGTVTVVPRLEWIIMRAVFVASLLTLYFLSIGIRAQVIIYQIVHSRRQTVDRPAPEWITASFLVCAVVAALWPR